MTDIKFISKEAQERSTASEKRVGSNAPLKIDDIRDFLMQKLSWRIEATTDENFYAVDFLEYIKSIESAWAAVQSLDLMMFFVEATEAPKNE